VVAVITKHSVYGYACRHCNACRHCVYHIAKREVVQWCRTGQYTSLHAHARQLHAYQLAVCLNLCACCCCCCCCCCSLCCNSHLHVFHSTVAIHRSNKTDGSNTYLKRKQATCTHTHRCSAHTCTHAVNMLRMLMVLLHHATALRCHKSE
jgi:hypothetical protein